MSETNTSNEIVIKLSERIDSNNAQAEEARIRAALSGVGGKCIVLDADRLDYISSAGLRVLLRLRKEHSELRIINVSSDVYDIFDMTGFTEMMSIEKSIRSISVEGCEKIGEGFNAAVYRMDGDTVVKVYKHGEGLSEIKHEQEVARLALILGVPTAISYDVVKVGSSYGSVFELLDARSFSRILCEEPERMDWCVKEYVDMLHTIHAITVPEGKLPHIKSEAIAQIQRIIPALPDGIGEKLLRMAQEIPDSNRLIHGDYHTQNIVLASGEVLLIDMDTLSVGHPIFELAQMFNSYIGFSEYDHEIVKRFQGFDQKTAAEFWQRSLRAYLETEDERRVSDVENKLRCIAYSDLIDWKTRHTQLAAREDRETVELWKRELTELVSRLDTLDFEIASGKQSDAPGELDIEAAKENLDRVLEFVNAHLERVSCPQKSQLQIDVAVEEVFINIASYAYTTEKGRATVRVEVSDEPITVTITFIDNGVPYDPLAKPDADTSLPLDRREIGGLGIFITKRFMDELAYEYKNGQNILKLKKNIGGGNE